MAKASHGEENMQRKMVISAKENMALNGGVMP